MRKSKLYRAQSNAQATVFAEPTTMPSPGTGGLQVQRFRLPSRLVDRTEYILSDCAGKKVLHLGCADFVSSGDWESVVCTDEWLHGRIREVAKEVVGIDNCLEAVGILRERYGGKDVLHGDAQCLDKLGLGKFDVVVAGEVLEHLPCPGMLLTSAHAVLREKGVLVASTTNAYCLRRFVMVPFGVEMVHDDHVAYFSHRTLRRLLTICGYEVVEQCSYRAGGKEPLLRYVAESGGGIKRFVGLAVERIASVVCPNLCEGIICRCKQNTLRASSEQN